MTQHNSLNQIFMDHIQQFLKLNLMLVLEEKSKDFHVQKWWISKNTCQRDNAKVRALVWQIKYIYVAICFPYMATEKYSNSQNKSWSFYYQVLLSEVSC